jgi:hypothetical protein
VSYDPYESRLRLLLVGDDDVLDALADLSRHLDYFEVARLDEPPPEPLAARDHIVIAHVDDARAARVLAGVRAAGEPGHAALVPSLPGMSTGARAIAAAAELVEVLRKL